jgi:hypothetical protein
MAITFSFSRVDTTQVFPLGDRRVEHSADVIKGNSTHNGDREWIYIKTNAALVAGNTVQRDDLLSYEGEVGTAVTAPRILGVAQHAIASGSYGWIVRKGVCEVLADGSVSANTPIEAVAAGSVTTYVSSADDDAAANVIGYALETDAGATLVTCVITLP